MEKTSFHDINDIEFEFETRTVRIIILQELPKIEVLEGSKQLYIRKK